MQLGFVSAILPDLEFAEVMALAAAEGYDCVELMCWPVGKAERRYAGVTHLDVAALDDEAVERVQSVCAETGVAISGLGYYPNPLASDGDEAATAIGQLERVIAAAGRLGLGVVNTFVGRDPKLSVDENWPRFLAVWPRLVKLAEDSGVRIGIENCPMLFTRDEWPGGKNLATSPATWRRMFEAIPSASFGLNFDPSHLVWQQLDIGQAVREFGARFVHVHAKDARVDRERLAEVGVLAYPNLWHTPKLPGLGDVDWGAFIATLADTGYDGPVCVEVEDRAFEGTLAKRRQALRQAAGYLRQFIGRE